MKKRSVLLIILDGWGMSNYKDGDPIQKAKTPTFDYLNNKYPPVTLRASGVDVGLPDGQMGNSEVGHLNLGAGRIVSQELPRITQAIQDESFFSNEKLIQAVEHASSNNSSLHLLGLISDGGVHSHNDHLFALLELAKRKQVKKVYLHALLDGRDTAPDSAIDFIAQVEKRMKQLKTGKFSTVMGRYYGMDRDNRWDRTQCAYQAIVDGKGTRLTGSIGEQIKKGYAEGVLDEFVSPLICNPSDPASFIQENDSLIIFNFRADRVRQIIKTFIDREFNNFSRTLTSPPSITCLTEYAHTFDLPVAFLPSRPDNSLGEVLSKKKLKQIRIAETEKYAHVTFFFNSGREEPFENEERVLIPSPKVATYDKQPEMSAIEVTDAVKKAIKSEQYDFILVNYANTDMVGHTGDFVAAVSAVETVDTCIAQLLSCTEKQEGAILITADHGNVEEMIQEQSGAVVTAHTTNKVPFFCIVNRKISLRKDGILADVAPTILSLLGVSVPLEMTGKNLIV